MVCTESRYFEAKVPKNTSIGINCYCYSQCQRRCCAGSWSCWLYYFPSKFQPPKSEVWAVLKYNGLFNVWPSNMPIFQVFSHSQDEKKCRGYWQIHQGQSFWWMWDHLLSFKEGLWKSCWKIAGSFLTSFIDWLTEL